MYKYILYKVTIMNNMPKWNYVSETYADNLIEAEFKFGSYMSYEGEYIITIKK